MYYKLSPTIALRSFKGVSHCYYRNDKDTASYLNDKEFEFLLLCDGEHDLPEDELTENFLRKKMIVPCEKGDHPSEWSCYKHYDNKYFPKMNFMITGKCNCNCLHCFNAADNAPLMSEWKYEDALDLLDQARDVGIHAFTITGGEPMVHKNFMDIMHAIYERDMIVDELNTNGFFITDEMLDELKSMGCDALIKISFDGIGYHDWMRNHKGAEKITLDAIKRCINHGFRVMAQTQVNAVNYDSLLPTLKLFDEIGVRQVRLIRTTEASRWFQNAGGATLQMDDYYERMLTLAKQVVENNLNIDLMIWLFMRLDNILKSYQITPITCRDGEYRPTAPVCKGTRGMIGVMSNGNLVPCIQMSGSLEELGIRYENVHEHKLKDLITESSYLDAVCTNLHKLRKNCKKCDECKYFKYCCGGCRGIGMICSMDKVEKGYHPDYYGPDLARCLFFSQGWYKKITAAFPDHENLSRAIDLEEE